MLSDGIASVKAIVSETVFNKMGQKPKRFDVIRVTSLKKIEVKKSDQETQWLVNLTSPVEVLFSNLTQVLGHPQEINSLNASKVDFTQVIPILGVEESVVIEQGSNKSAYAPTTSATSRASLQPVMKH